MESPVSVDGTDPVAGRGDGGHRRPDGRPGSGNAAPDLPRLHRADHRAPAGHGAAVRSHHGPPGWKGDGRSFPSTRLSEKKILLRTAVWESLNPCRSIPFRLFAVGQVSGFSIFRR